MARDWKGGNASTFKTIGASNHCDYDRADMDYYATEPAATDWLCHGLRLVRVGEGVEGFAGGTLV